MTRGILQVEQTHSTIQGASSRAFDLGCLVVVLPGKDRVISLLSQAKATPSPDRMDRMI
jgi:hypothetical protein